MASKLDLDGKTVGYSGTRPYMAPEIYRKERYGTAADIWSLGIVLYELLFGSVPWGKKVNTATNKWIDKFDDAGVSRLWRAGFSSEKNFTRGSYPSER